MSLALPSAIFRFVVRSTTCALLGLALVPRAAAAGSATLGWHANGEPEIAGYRLVYGTQPGNHTLEIDVGNRTTFTVTDLESGRYYFAVTAYNTAGMTSRPSSELQVTIPPPSESPPPADPPTTAHRGYFAEGVEADGFETRFALLNPTDDPAAVTMIFQDEEGTEHTRAVDLGPRTRATIIAARDLPALTGRPFSTRVEADAPVVVDRTVTWRPGREGGGREGAHLETMLAAPSTRWYFTEGMTLPGLDLFYYVHNPQDAPAELRVTSLLTEGRSPETRRYTIAPRSRLTIWVNDEGHPPSGGELSAIVESINGVPVVAERALYLSDRGEPFVAGTASGGAAAPSTQWYFGGGETGDYFDLFLALANPHDTAAEVRATYLLPTGRTVQRTYALEPRSRKTVYVDHEGADLSHTSMSTVLESTNGVSFLAERSTWWPGSPAGRWHGSHGTVGATRTSTRWALAEGEVGGPARLRTYLFVANTSPTVGTARVTLLFEDGSSAMRTYELPARSHTSISVARDFPESKNRRFGALVESVGKTPAALVVERALYWNANGRRRAAGAAALGSPLRR
ncbi:MAG: fibronectin type III domain-containing protein [Vicinamibacteraceae bacterium]